MKISKAEYLRSLVAKNYEPQGYKANVEDVAGSGQELVGADIAKDMVDLIVGDKGLLADVEVYQVTSNKNRIKVPKLTDPLQFGQGTAPVGTRSYFLKQANPATASVASLDQVTIELDTLATLVQMSEELVGDVGNIDAKWETMSSNAARKAIMWSAIFGSGSGNPVKGVGFLGDGQAATIHTDIDQVPTESQLKAAYLLLHPSAIEGAKWYVSQAVLASLQDSAYECVDRTLGVLTVYGIPVEVCPFMSVAPRHVLLGNFAGYGLAMKVVLKDRSAEAQVAFLSNSEFFRSLLRVGGNAIAENSPLDDGTTRAWFVSPTETVAYEIFAGDTSSYPSVDVMGEVYPYGKYLNEDLYRNKNGAWAWSDGSKFYIGKILGDTTNCYEGDSLEGDYEGHGTYEGDVSLGAEASSESSDSSDSSGSSVSEVSSASSASSQLSNSSASSQSDSSQSVPVALTVSSGLSPTAAGSYVAVGTHNGSPSYKKVNGAKFLWLDSVSNSYVLSAVVGITTPGYANNTVAGTDPTGTYTAGGTWTGTATVTA